MSHRPGAAALLRVLAILPFFSFGGCASSKGSLRIREASVAYQREDYIAAEAALHRPEIADDESSRLQHYLLLSSLAFARGLYEKATFYLEKSRHLAGELRSSQGFEAFSREYRSNPVEFSRIHFLLVLSRSLLAQEGGTPAWNVPEFRSGRGEVLIPFQEFPARRFTEKEREDLRSGARADLLAWDSHLNQLRRSYEGSRIYHEDPLARVLASFLHGRSPLPRERRTAELLVKEALREVENLRGDLRGFQQDEETRKVLFDRLAHRASGKGGDADASFFVLEEGLQSPYRQRKVLVGLSSIFREVQDPLLRAQLEQLSLRVLLQFAPEFGLVAFTGALAGAATAGAEDPPQFISDATDEAFGFQMSFPTLPSPPEGFRAEAVLRGQDGRESRVDLPLANPLQELMARELRERASREWKQRALKVGLEYLAILVPAVLAYERAVRDGDWLRKLAILTGYFLAKKTVDRLNAPDLRSWEWMPRQVFAGATHLTAGSYDLSWRLFRGSESVSLTGGKVEVPIQGGMIFFRRTGNAEPMKFQEALP